MKKINVLLVSLLLVMSGVFTSCTKDDTGSSTLDFFGGSFIDDNATALPGGSLAFKFTATSETSMEYMEITMTGYGQVWDAAIENANKNSYTKEVTLTAPTNAGVYTYNFIVYDSDAADANVIVEKSIVITVSATADYNSYSGKLLYAPDLAKNAKVYFASTTGETYSFNGIGTNSGLVDWGYYYGTNAHHTFFALTQQPTLGYDIANWTKNATKFKKLTGVTFANIATAAEIVTACGTIGTAEAVETLAVNSIVGFKTATKYGVIKITAISADSNAEGTFITFDVKVQK